MVEFIVILDIYMDYLEMAKRRDFEDVYVHCFLDGRDTPPASAEGYITQLEEKMKEKGSWKNSKYIRKILCYG